MKQMISLLTAAALSVTTLNACGQSENGKMSIQEQIEQRFQLNPNPKEAYRIRIKINDAPGPLKSMDTMSVGYKAENCSYVINKFEGASAHPRKDVDPPVRQIGEYEYEAVFYLDAVQDEDYFGQGVCHWKPEGFGIGFIITGKPEETAFNFGDFIYNLLEKKTLTRYYWKARYPYPIHPQKDYIDFGRESVNDFSAENQKNLFTITVTLEEVK